MVDDGFWSRGFESYAGIPSERLSHVIFDPAGTTVLAIGPISIGGYENVVLGSHQTGKFQVLWPQRKISKFVYRYVSLSAFNLQPWVCDEIASAYTHVPSSLLTGQTLTICEDTPI